MLRSIEAVALPLFVPASRPDRFGKAFRSGADAVILDLEDAVAFEDKANARQALVETKDALAGAPCPVVLRVNAIGSPFHADDIGVAGRLPSIDAVMLAKAETAFDVQQVARTTGRPVVALIETARGLADVRAIAAAAARLAFGSFDFAADLGCAHDRDALLLARLELVLASRLGHLPAPLDGVTLDLRNPDRIADDARYAASLGMAGKLLIHPAQVDPAKAGLRPSADDLAWADRMLATHDGASAVDGVMVDAPVRLRAVQIRNRAMACT